ncbi:hypothetical protein [Kribbella sp. VKM Ac-2566]|uniref:hypothetical protein n=1 Tax=Kribbella sp. VKM Ac-2566 TaxID=2512218 RepID=UPI0010629E2A|nr:hypothetical protein [Kribbella sp. VKM Ac-2566]TDW86488.1 hypothetical protein EV647_6578 [Kribbella sp. VKM Ac-2566]
MALRKPIFTYLSRPASSVRSGAFTMRASGPDNRYSSTSPGADTVALKPAVQPSRDVSKSQR